MATVQRGASPQSPSKHITVSCWSSEIFLKFMILLIFSG
ncbi:unnamed protein product [Haemonchus placei]|uniref:Uncharacterized protein n=1 Tax=Haemonchus placei TaxID=6290 RepID=A0A0N4WUA5_HAEPC|nr:unnamed protein product [Haemonchus placei]